MIPEHIRAGLAKLSGRYIIEHGVTPGLLAEAERSLGFCLPEDVRAFTIEFAAIHRPSDSFAILFPGASLAEGQGESAYRYTLDHRLVQKLPPKALVLDGKDYPLICLDASELAGPVFTFHDGRIDRELAPDFFAYLTDWINFRLNEE